MILRAFPSYNRVGATRQRWRWRWRWRWRCLGEGQSLHECNSNYFLRKVKSYHNPTLITCHTNEQRHTSHARDYHSQSSSISSRHESPVVIIGGGPTGLCLSILLSQYNIPSTLIEARTIDEIHKPPQAHYLNLRTMELLRHSMPNVYNDVLAAMPPVDHWEGFTFSHSVLGRQIARVVHPVKGVGNAQDGNGRLVDHLNSDEVAVSSEETTRTMGGTTADFHEDYDRISICNPGHLGQNKFASILLKEARRASSYLPTSQIIHGEKVEQIETAATTTMNATTQSKLYPIKVQTSSGKIFHTEYVIAADGSSSTTRSQNDNGLGMTGNSSMQYLINVHFRTSNHISKQLKERKETIGMLHFVFHQHLVGAFVCHDLEGGDWVLQIPFFPPFQDWKHYDEKTVRSIVLSGLGVTANDGNQIELDLKNDIEILSIKPWTMAATVAPSYFIGESNRIILAGDAAHAFPPAGGFGMNTGIQDAQNLAWRLASVIDGHEKIHDNGIDNSSPTSYSHDIHPILKMYESERRPVASQNAALSVRNYNRTLDIAKACYLNADHPTLLKTIMSSPPMTFIPLQVRQQMFETSVKTAMMPLSNLAHDGNLFSKRITKNIRQILLSGGGLPLLFPRYEVGFSYDNSSSLLDEGDDTAGFIPSIKVGLRMPHIPVKIVRDVNYNDDDSSRDINNNDEKISSDQILSLTDIESQLSTRWNHPKVPRFSMIVFDVNQHTFDDLEQWKECLREEIGNHQLAIIEVYSDSDRASLRRKECIREHNEHAVLQIIQQHHSTQTILDEFKTRAFAVLIRPDGHVQKVLRRDSINHQ